jgi:predicted class III extradiol MEMO1 family dioxygenase
MPEVRRAAHAGSWYKSKGPLLNYQLGEWLNLVPRRTVPIGTASSQAGPVDLQDERIRAVIAP